MRFLYAVDDAGLGALLGTADTGSFITGWFVDQIRVLASGTVSGTAPAITQPPQSQTVTAGTDVSFTIAASGTGPLSYQWLKDGAPIANATGTTFSISNANTAAAGNYSVRVSNSAGSATSTAAALGIITITAPGVTSSADFALAGSTANPATILGVTVNGQPVQTGDGFAHWSAPSVNLAPGQNTLTVVVNNNASAGGGISPAPATQVYTWPVYLVTSSNLLDFAFNRSAGNSNPSTPLQPVLQNDPDADGKYLTFTYHRRIVRDGLAYGIQLSEDTAAWRNATAAEIKEVGAPVSNPDGVTEAVTVRLKSKAGEAGLPQRFVRVSVTAI